MTSNTQIKEDFLQALSDDPAFKTAVWEALMPEDDAATMPALMAAILDELREMRRTQGEMQRTQEEMQRTQEESRKTQESMLDSIGKMADDIDSMATDIGHLVGDNLERKMGYALPSELRTGYGVREMSVLVYPAREETVTPDFLDDLNAALESGTITEDERDRVIKTDMIVAERDDNHRRTRFFVAEASNSINNDDIDRAIRTTEILERILEPPVVSIAFGHQASDAVRRYNSGEASRRVRIITVKR